MSHQLFYIGRCSICFVQNTNKIGPLDLEKKSFEWFLPYMGDSAILNFVLWVLKLDLV